MKLMLQFIAIGTFILCLSCKAKDPMKMGIHGNNPISATPIIIDKSLTRVFDMAHKIDTAYVFGDTLTLEISFINACPTDTFEVVGNGKFAKSNPPLTAVFIRRKNSNSECSGTLKKELKCDISSLKYPLMNKIILNIDEHLRIPYFY